MERRRPDRAAAASGGVARPQALAQIEALVAAGGHIVVGTMDPIQGAAVAHDGRNTLAMLRRKPAESVTDLLVRLDTAIGTAKTTGKRVDEINPKSATDRYEL